MYIAAKRMADCFGCDLIGIQYQQGLKDMTPASDLAKGPFNNVGRPPVYHPTTSVELYPGQALPHFNEVDEGTGMGALVTTRIWTALGLDPATTLHDIRRGRQYRGDGFEDQEILCKNDSTSAAVGKEGCAPSRVTDRAATAWA